MSGHATRRRFLIGAAGAVAAAGAGVARASDRYREMSRPERETLLARLEERARERHRVHVSIDDTPAQTGVTFAFCLDLNKCNGSRACVRACLEENNQGGGNERSYIKVLETDRAGAARGKGDPYYERPTANGEERVYLPVQCQHCAQPPCAKVCPVDAIWKEPDGIVALDYDRCIGCRHCMAACSYEALRFNFKAPRVAPGALNPNQAYLGNRDRPRGVVEKCHLCIQRTRRGDFPACLEACPTGARKFGNLADPTSDVARIVKEQKVFVLKSDASTEPRFFYYYG